MTTREIWPRQPSDRPQPGTAVPADPGDADAEPTGGEAAPNAVPEAGHGGAGSGRHDSGDAGGHRFGRFGRDWFTTPRLLWICAGVCVVLCVIAAAGTFSMAQRRAHAVAAISGAVMERTEASWDIHRSLARAAAAEAETFIGPPPEDAQAPAAAPRSGAAEGAADASREGIYHEFDQALLTAAGAMVRAGAGISPATAEQACPSARTQADPPSPASEPAAQAAAALTTLVCLTPAYQELIGEARANNRAGNSVGQAYLRSANALMNDRLLPASATLARSHTTEQARQFERATRSRDIVWLAVAAGLGLVALIGTQILCVLWTRRWVNPAMVAATLLALGGMVWPLVALADERSALASASESHQVRGLLARANHLALRAEADVLYWRIAQGGDIAFDDDYDQTAPQLACAALGSTTAEAPGRLCAAATSRQLDARIISLVKDAWDAGSNAIGSIGSAGPSGRLGAPDDPQAVPVALERFAALDEALTGADADARARFTTEVSRADRALWGVAIGALLLFGGAAVLVAIGLEPRIREYR
ncbi:hypothetical protein [Parafrankia elaeagni]|uniref:hypothetical protein n=1 Tax=Parafrankia elaeagni TaxID=222534 RepID=UPI0006862ECE|nr:hypothetical protein [Parafrankia elaeagni]